jgi:hypothetical protein
LLDTRHRQPCFIAEHHAVHRHLAPAEQKQLAKFQDILDDRLGVSLCVRVVVWQKKHPDSEIAVVV